MASKKKRNRPRPQGASRPAAKPSGPAGPPPKPAGAGKAAAKSVPAKAGRDRSGPTRAERLAAAEAARRRRAARNRALVTAAIVGILTLITVTVINTRRSNDRTVSKLEASGSCEYDTRADTDAGAGRNHISGDISYEVDPPSGGNHNPTPAPAGIFTLESKPPDAQIVHSLEHGYVAIWYRPDLDAASLDDLQDLAGRYDRDVLLVPRPSLPPTQPVAATAWHRRLLCSKADVGSLESFVSAYANKGPEKVEH